MLIIFSWFWFCVVRWKVQLHWMLLFWWVFCFISYHHVCFLSLEIHIFRLTNSSCFLGFLTISPAPGEYKINPGPFCQEPLNEHKSDFISLLNFAGSLNMWPYGPIHSPQNHFHIRHKWPNGISFHVIWLLLSYLENVNSVR